MGRERWEERPGSLFSPHTHAPKGSPELSQAVPGLPQQVGCFCRWLGTPGLRDLLCWHRAAPEASLLARVPSTTLLTKGFKPSSLQGGPAFADHPVEHAAAHPLCSWPSPAGPSAPPAPGAKPEAQPILGPKS